MAINERKKEEQKPLNWQKNKKVIVGILSVAIIGGTILGWNVYRAYITEQEKIDSDVHIFDKDGNEIPLNQP